MPVDPARVKSLFLAASDLTDAAERAAFLDRECGTDTELRARVEALLCADAAPCIELPTIDRPVLATTESHPNAVTGTFGEPGSTPSLGVEAGASFTPGALIGGRYTLVELIGEGGMGSVYLASQTEPVKRQVALKLIKAGMDSKTVLARFDAERQALALMDHPNIARVYDGGSTEMGQPFFVMELVKGVPLTEYCDSKRLTVNARLQLFVQVCQAVQHAHQKGIIHRDLKPGNVLVTEVDGRPTPKVIDFGVAKATELRLTDMSFSDTGAIVGTPAYMSPEQADPTSMDIDTRSDVYALGVILYELLTGSPPIDGKQFKRGAILEMLRMVREVEAPRPSTKLSTADALPNIAANRSIEPGKLAKLLRGELDWVVLKALEKDRTRRYDTANGFARDIQRYLADEVVEARPPNRGYRLKKFVKRNKGQVIAASLVLLALVGGVLGTSIGMIEAGKQTVKANAAAERADDEKRESEKQLDRAERLVYAGKLYQAQSAFAEGKGDVAIQHLEDCQWNLRGWEHRHLWTRLASKQTFVGHTSSVQCVAFSPDGKRILSGSADHTLKLWDTESGLEIIAFKGHTHYLFRVAFSPDGKRILSGSGDKTLKLWDAKTGREIFTLNGHSDRVIGVAFSPDGKLGLSGSEDKLLKMWDIENGMEIRTLKGHTHPVSAVAFSPNGKHILSGSADKTLKFWDAKTGQELRTLKGHAAAVWSVAFSPDGKSFLSGSMDNSLKLWDSESGREILTLKGHTHYVTAAVYSPDGNRILSGSADMTLRVWDAEKGKEILTLKGHTDIVLGVAFSPDGNRILSGSGDRTLRVWDAEKRQEILNFTGQTDQVTSVAFSPDGKKLLSGSGGYDIEPKVIARSGELKLWDAEKGQENFTLKGHTLPVSAVSFSPDGNRILSGSWDKTLKLWDAKKGKEICTLTGHSSAVTSVSFSPDGKRVLSGSADMTLKIWDAEKGQENFTLTGHTAAVNCVSFSPDGKRLLSGSEDRSLRIWDAENGQVILTLEGHTKGVKSAAFSPDGKRVLSAGGEDKSLKLWDAENGQELLTLKGHTNQVTCVAFSPDGTRLISGSWDKTLKLWDAEQGQELITLKGENTALVISVWFSPDGKRLLSGGLGEYDYGSQTNPLKLQTWDAEKGQEILALKGHTSGVTCSEFSPNNKRILSGSMDKTLKLWDAEKGRELLTLKGHTDGVTCVEFSPDGKSFLSGSYDQTLKLWDAEKGREILTLKGHTKQVAFVAFSADSKRLFAWDIQSKVLAWSSETGQLVDPIDPPTKFLVKPRRSPDGFRTATPQDFAIAITDSRIPRNDNSWPLPVAAERQRYHAEQAAIAEKEKQWFAVAFHVGRLLIDEPENAEFKKRKEEALKKHFGEKK